MKFNRHGLHAGCASIGAATQRWGLGEECTDLSVQAHNVCTITLTRRVASTHVPVCSTLLQLLQVRMQHKRPGTVVPSGRHACRALAGLQEGRPVQQLGARILAGRHRHVPHLAQEDKLKRWLLGVCQLQVPT